jgi:hypothetical protein
MAVEFLAFRRPRPQNRPPARLNSWVVDRAVLSPGREGHELHSYHKTPLQVVGTAESRALPVAANV